MRAVTDESSPPQLPDTRMSGQSIPPKVSLILAVSVSSYLRRERVREPLMGPEFPAARVSHLAEPAPTLPTL